jgi:hypothetical protein
MIFENSDNIQWEEGEVTLTSPDSIFGEVEFLNPPKFFTLRGIRYRFLKHSITMRGGNKDGEVWLRAQKTDNGEKSEYVWVCEDKPGEFVQVFIPFEMRAEPFVEGR